MQVSVSYEFIPRTATVRSSLVMDHFGIDFEQGRHVVADQLELPILPGQVVLFTGPSGSGKSSIMRGAGEELARSASVIHVDRLDLGENLLIDSLPVDAIEAMQLLSQCGLGEARLLLRRPQELSDGQRYRFRLALALSQRPDWIVADEFTATLDRVLAKVVAFNIRRLADRMGVGFLLATTHDDVADDLAADVHVRCDLDGGTRVALKADEVSSGSSGQGGEQAEVNAGRKKKESALNRNCGSARRPAATGRTSRGGITEVISLV
jgi:uncharacterized protein